MNKTQNYQIITPGKVMITGEYGVLEGGPAIVATIDRIATARIYPTSQKEYFFSTAFKKILTGQFPLESVKIDTSQFFGNSGQKLGIGSSAAQIICAVGLYMEQNNLPIQKFQSELIDVSIKIHQLSQAGLGSGSDIRTMVYGGIVLINDHPFRLNNFPMSLRWIHCPTTLSTKDILQYYQTYRITAQKTVYQMIGVAQKFISGFKQQNINEILECMRESAQLYQALSDCIKIPLISEQQKYLITWAQQNGGQAKPSGAGGGDLLLAVFKNEEKADEFCRKLPIDCQVVPFAFSQTRAHCLWQPSAAG